MKLRSGILTVLGGLAVVAAGGFFLFSSPADSDLSESIETASLQGSAVLDGMSFTAELGLTGKPPDIDDRLEFSNGMFVSRECERQCNYPASPYFTRQNGDAIEFISETRCLTKDATIVWRGTIVGDRVSGHSTWTLNRWYWSIEKEFEFEGVLADASAPLASTE